MPNIHPIDRAIGCKLKQLRRQKGWSQQQLAASLLPPVSFQQIQKYEKGSNRLPIARLIEIAHVLQIRIEDFLGEITTSPPQTAPELSLSDQRFIEDYATISPQQKRALRFLLKAFSE